MSHRIQASATIQIEAGEPFLRECHNVTSVSWASSTALVVTWAVDMGTQSYLVHITQVTPMDCNVQILRLGAGYVELVLAGACQSLGFRIDAEAAVVG
jgi:hypothetical protein